MVYLAILISAILYRVPRGGPDGDVWKRWIGFAPGSRLSTSIWAAWTAGSLVYLIGLPWWVALVGFGYLSYAESRAYMHMVAEHEVDIAGLTKRGLILLNPAMGWIYEFMRRYAKRWPIWQPLIDGWTVYAEVACGLVTAGMFALILAIVG